MLSAALLSVVVLSVGKVMSVVWLLYLYFSKRGKKKMKFLVCREKGITLLQVWFVCRLCATCKCACLCVGYFTIITKVPAIIKPAPIAVFNVNVSPKKIIAKMIVKATLSLSIGATCDTFPNCNALK